MLSENLRHLHDALGVFGDGPITVPSTFIKSLRERLASAAEAAAALEHHTVPDSARIYLRSYPENVVPIRARTESETVTPINPTGGSAA